jgi:hypothetical protein
MPTNRTRRPRSPSPDALTPEAIRAWHLGDFHQVARECAIAPCDWHPFDVSTNGLPPAYVRSSWQLASWNRAQELRRALLEVAGEPGECDRHGEPLGPAG